MKKYYWTIIVAAFLGQTCSQKNSDNKDSSLNPDTLTSTPGDSSKIRVIFDSDTNNELDDQHALAYLLFNGGRFQLAGVTVNSTRGGGRIEGQFAEAERVVRLCGFSDNKFIYKGANSSFDTIRKRLKNKLPFDGEPAVRFIIEQAKKPADKKLVVIAVGKLTNLALALEIEPGIAKNIRLVWLGSNYPEPGEYNLDNDTASVNYVMDSKVDFEVVTVRYGKGTGSDAVRMTKDDVNKNLRGKGPSIQHAVTGRHGGEFKTFGDYSLSLFENAHYNGTPPSRALFDLVAVAVVKNPDWGTKQIVPAPKLVNNQWVAQPHNPRTVIVWENFDKEKILGDFYQSLNHYQLVRAGE